MNTAPATTPSTRTGWARVWLWLAGVLLTLLLLLLGIAWWAGSEGSLARAMHLAQHWLPEDQQLVFDDVQGSITGGGHIGRLQWSKPGSTVTIEDLRMEWSLRLLFGRALRVRTLSARLVHLRSTPQPDKPDEPFTMPAELSLPIKVEAPLAIARVQIESVDADGISGLQVLEDLTAHYSYDGEQHALRFGLRHGRSDVQAELQVHARELTLSAQLAASVRDLVPDTPFAMLARVQVNGSLAAGDAARLEVQLDARQQPHAAPAPAATNLLAALATLRTTPGNAGTGAASADAGAQVHASAAIHPWRKQPVQQVELQISQLNAHAFHALLGEVSSEEVDDGNSMLSVLVISKENNVPGAGFYELARVLGREVGDRDETRISEFNRVTSRWRR